MMYPGVMPDYMGWMMVSSYLLWAIVIAVGVFFAVRIARSSDGPRAARSILAERLARGEINEEQFRGLLAALKA
jgi:uncharacterized membrane protein